MIAKYCSQSHLAVVVQPWGLPVWRRLLQVRELAKDSIRWKVGKGLIDFWYDVWIGDRPLIEFSRVIDPPHCLVAEFFTPQGWNENQLRLWLPQFWVQQILTITVDSSVEDKLVWKDSPSGMFTVASAWDLIRRKLNRSLVLSQVWSIKLPLKV